MPMPAPTWGLKVIAVNAPSATPSNGQAGDRDEAAAARPADPDGDDDTDDEAERADVDHPDDQRADTQSHRDIQPFADRRVELVEQVEAEHDTDDDADDDRHQQGPTDPACRDAQREEHGRHGDRQEEVLDAVDDTPAHGAEDPLPEARAKRR